MGPSYTGQNKLHHICWANQHRGFRLSACQSTRPMYDWWIIQAPKGHKSGVVQFGLTSRNAGKATGAGWGDCRVSAIPQFRPGIWGTIPFLEDLRRMGKAKGYRIPQVSVTISFIATRAVSVIQNFLFANTKSALTFNPGGADGALSSEKLRGSNRLMSTEHFCGFAGRAPM